MLGLFPLTNRFYVDFCRVIGESDSDTPSFSAFLAVFFFLLVSPAMNLLLESVALAPIKIVGFFLSTVYCYSNCFFFFYCSRYS